MEKGTMELSRICEAILASADLSGMAGSLHSQTHSSSVHPRPSDPLSSQAHRHPAVLKYDSACD